MKVTQISTAQPGWYAYYPDKEEQGKGKLPIAVWALAEKSSKESDGGKMAIHPLTKGASGGPFDVVVGLVFMNGTLQNAEVITGFSGYFSSEKGPDQDVHMTGT